MAKKHLIWVEEVRAQMIVPGRTNPLARSAFGEQLKKHAIEPQLLPFEGTHRAYVTKDEAKRLVDHFELLHWRKKQRTK